MLTKNKGENNDQFHSVGNVLEFSFLLFSRKPWQPLSGDLNFPSTQYWGGEKVSKNFLSANTFNPGVGEKVQKTFYLQTRFTLTPCLLQGWEGTTQYWGGIQISSPKLLRPCSRPILGREGIIQTRPPNGVKSGPHPVLGWGNFPVFFWHLQSCPMRGQPQIQSFLRQWICYV